MMTIEIPTAEELRNEHNERVEFYAQNALAEIVETLTKSIEWSRKFGYNIASCDITKKFISSPYCWDDKVISICIYHKVEKIFRELGYEVTYYTYSKTTYNKSGRYAEISVKW